MNAASASRGWKSGVDAHWLRAFSIALAVLGGLAGAMFDLETSNASFAWQ